MSKYHFIDPEIRRQVLHRIQSDGIPAAQAAREHGVNVNTVYNWLSKTATTTSSASILQVNKLKRENEELYRLLGKTVVEIERSKKNRSGYAI
jgi:transposase-like protein